MTLNQFIKKKLESFDYEFKCPCMLCAEKGYPFETTNGIMKEFITQALKELAETIATDYKKGFLEMNRNYIISTRLNTNANRLGKFVIPEEEYWSNLEEFINNNGTE